MLDRLLSRCQRIQSGCLEWTGPNVRGYGRAWFRGRVRIVTRAVWEATHGEIPPKMVVAHRCDNPKCCDVTHLFLATQKENLSDRNRKGRTHRAIPEDVIKKAIALKMSGLSGYAIGNQLGITRAYLYRVFKGEFRA